MWLLRLPCAIFNNRKSDAGHQTNMPFSLVPKVFCGFLALSLAGVVACTTKENPDEIREKTAQATAEMRRDAKAMAEGVKEGWQNGKTIDLNTATRDQMLSLPGVTPHQADRIISGRPYDNSHDLVARHLVPEEEYDKIKDRLTASH
jgi:DNA uptake protein ComE-like DNA-binding protein